MAKYENMTANNNVDLVFNLYSANSEGDSVRSNIIRVPKKKDRCPLPRNIKKILDNQMYTYTLSWSSPRHTDNISSYTVFWCVTKFETPNLCDVSIKKKIYN